MNAPRNEICREGAARTLSHHDSAESPAGMDEAEGMIKSSEVA